MIYFIYGNQNIRIKKQLKAIASKSLETIDEMNFVKFDGNLTVVQEAVDEANYVPLGYDRKVVAIENSYFLNKEKTKNKIESDQDYKILIDYIENPNPDCDFIFTVVASDIDSKNSVYKALVDNNATIVPIKEPNATEWFEIVKKYCSEKFNSKIDGDALRELANRTNGDYGLLTNSVAKLSLYTDHVSLNDVVLMIARPLEDNSFQLFNFLIKGQNSKAVGLFRDLQVSNTNAIVLISLLANQFRLLDQIFYLSKEKLSADEMAKELGIKPIRVQIMSNDLKNIKQSKVKETLESLFQLDKDIKSGLVDRDYAFELFLIKFNAKY